MPDLSFSPTQAQGPKTMPVMAVRDLVFPHTVSSLYIGRANSIKALEKADQSGKEIFLVLQKNPNQEEISSERDELCTIGTVCRILQRVRLADDSVKVLFGGLYRAKFDKYSEKKGYPSALVTAIQESASRPEEIKVLGQLAQNALEGYVKAGHKIKPEQYSQILAISDASSFADSVATKMDLDPINKQKLLEMLDVNERLESLCGFLNSDASTSSIEKKIKTRIREQTEKSQKEYYLNEQLRAINKELGREEDPLQEINQLEEEIKKKDLPEYARKKALSEIKKLRNMTPIAAEYTILRSYVDWILALPWNKLSNIDIDIKKAREILDADHFGLEKPKERILEYLAVQKLSQGLKGPILCFVGPPGVGKTSLAKSVAKATGREYLRLSLGGVHDEAEIRGHRRTYIGALPGKIIQSLHRVQFNNPLFCLDEVDKLASDYRGDPAAALLEVLDPEQNCTFLDHYLDLDYDLSKIFFIMTANSLDTIPAPLLDRMEVIELHSYLETEKFHIAKDFLIPRQIKENGLKPSNILITDETLLRLIQDYTSEAGVRELERRIAKLCRKTAVAMLENNDLERLSTITPEQLPDLLGPKTKHRDKKEETSRVGVCTGLAWTSVGGEILFIEAGVVEGTGQISTTGKLGDVMQESAKAALTYVRSRRSALNLKEDFLKQIDIHVHVPDGATPKDGPSAGITIVTALTSALTGIPVRNDTAMTGEISLRGRVLPIGGLREKLLGAKKAGIHRIIVPKDNEEDIKDVPKEVLEGLQLFFVGHMDEVLPLALLEIDATRFPNEATSKIWERLQDKKKSA